MGKFGKIDPAKMQEMMDSPDMQNQMKNFKF
jgi:hypothetical protein